MLLIGILLGLLTGVVLGGRVERLLDARVRWVSLVFVALAIRFGTQAALANGVSLADTLRTPLFAASFALLMGALWINRAQPGLLAVLIGVGSNGLAIIANGGWMPVYMPALDVVGFTAADLQPSFHRPLPEELGLDFILRAGPIADILPIPLPILPNVASPGDVFISAGLGWFVFATLVREPGRVPGSGISMLGGQPSAAAGIALDRPLVLGGGMGPGLPTAAAPAPTSDALAPAEDAQRAPALPLRARVRAHPYMRLALDARFTAFWLAQTTSLFGDRLHQIALGVLVYAATDSALLTGLVFLAATLPNLLLGPIAGTFVDRWDHKRVLIASDVLRALLVLVVPVAAATEILLVYPLVFAITTVSLFFRPAKAAVLPRIVRQEDLLAANSATWTGETLADIGGYPLAGLFVAFLGEELAVAFWLDSATYILSGLLLVGITIPPVAREARDRAEGALRLFLAELSEGWRFLRGQPALFQNTVISAVAQTSIGATLALTVVLARDALDQTLIPYPGNYAAIEAAIGVGNLVGGLAVGAIGARFRKGSLVVGGFLAMGLACVVLGFSGHVLLALAAALALGVANLVYVIPTQTLFAELTPIELMGRVVAFRSSLVFGTMTAAMAVSAALAEEFPVGMVIAGFGVVTLASGLVAAALPHVRSAS